MKNLKNKKRGECYWVGETPYLSVTKILTVIDKPALRYWFGKEVYFAMAKDPSLSEKEALAAPYKTSDKAKNRGSAVHSIIESWKTISEVVGKEGPYKNYAMAFQDWLDDHDVEVLESERTVVSRKYGYAGTLDMLAEVNGRRTLIDVKTGKAIYPEVHLQLSAYSQALEEILEAPDSTAVLLLTEEGKYTYEKGKDQLEAFLAAKKLYEFINQERLERLGFSINAA
jgi:hypothetical protein